MRTAPDTAPGGASQNQPTGGDAHESWHGHGTPADWQSVRSAVRFWLFEIWRSPWDHERRALLIKHYWSYLRFPPLPSSHLPDPRLPERVEQVKFSEGYLDRIGYVQSSARRRAGVHLTFRPIGKNLRLLGTAVRANVDRSRRTFIEREGPRSEIRQLQKKGYEWSPWLWSRGDSGEGLASAAPDAAVAWGSYFNQPVDSKACAARRVPPPRSLRVTEAPFRRSHLERLLKVAVATSHVFEPVEAIRCDADARRKRMAWPTNGQPVLGIHVRRGDAAVSQGKVYSPQNSTRASFPLEEYLRAADIVCARYGIRHIFMATEATEEIVRARRLRPQYRFLSLEHDRSIFPDLATSPRFIEETTFEHPERARRLAMSAILDLYFLGECHAFVGTFNSEFSVLAWQLMVGRRGHLVPYISLSQASQRRSLHPYAALLNLRNNCPLELYHW